MERSRTSLKSWTDRARSWWKRQSQKDCLPHRRSSTRLLLGQVSAPSAQSRVSVHAPFCRGWSADCGRVSRWTAPNKNWPHPSSQAELLLQEHAIWETAKSSYLQLFFQTRWKSSRSAWTSRPWRKFAQQKRVTRKKHNSRSASH